MSAVLTGPDRPAPASAPVSAPASAPVSAPVAAQWSAIGVTVRVVVTDPDCLDAARRIVATEVDALDLACSRFRDDSELVRLDAAAGLPVAVSPLLAEAIDVALTAARDTGGDVDPALGAVLEDLGYDRDFAALPADGPAVRITVQRLARWRQITLDRAAGTVQVPAGVRLDLGATAKAFGADRAAARVYAELGTGVLVSLGGDIAVAGAAPIVGPDGEGWAVRVQDRPAPMDVEPDGPTATVAITEGGIATSSITARRWVRGGTDLHHVIDPRTGLPAVTPWRTVTVAARSCVAANVATTAAIVRGEGAVEWLLQCGFAARLVGLDGRVVTLGGWPADAEDGVVQDRRPGAAPTQRRAS